MDPQRAYATEGQEETEELPTKEDMKLELVLRKYESINPSREFRCFVREDILLGTLRLLRSILVLGPKSVPSLTTSSQTMAIQTVDKN